MLRIDESCTGLVLGCWCGMCGSFWALFFLYGGLLPFPLCKLEPLLREYHYEVITVMILRHESCCPGGCTPSITTIPLPSCLYPVPRTNMTAQTNNHPLLSPLGTTANSSCLSYQHSPPTKPNSSHTSYRSTPRTTTCGATDNGYADNSRTHYSRPTRSLRPWTP